MTTVECDGWSVEGKHVTGCLSYGHKSFISSSFEHLITNQFQLFNILKHIKFKKEIGFVFCLALPVALKLNPELIQDLQWHVMSFFSGSKCKQRYANDLPEPLFATETQSM